MKEDTELESLTPCASEGIHRERISHKLCKRRKIYWKDLSHPVQTGKKQRKNLLPHLVRVKEDAEEESFTNCSSEGDTEEESMTTRPSERANRGRISHTLRRKMPRSFVRGKEDAEEDSLSLTQAGTDRHLSFLLVCTTKTEPTLCPRPLPVVRTATSSLPVYHVLICFHDLFPSTLSVSGSNKIRCFLFISHSSSQKTKQPTTTKNQF